MFPLVPAYPGCPGSKAVKRSLLLLLLVINSSHDKDVKTASRTPRLLQQQLGQSLLDAGRGVTADPEWPAAADGERRRAAAGGPERVGRRSP